MSENPKELLCTFSLYKKIIIGNDAGTIINQSISIHSGKIFFYFVNKIVSIYFYLMMVHDTKDIRELSSMSSEN